MSQTYSGTNARGESYTRNWDFGPRVPNSRQAALARVDRLSQLLDTALVIPGTSIRFGADALIGLVPGIGDALMTAVSCWIVYEAHQLGAPRHVIVRMLANVAIDGIVGSIPIAGDAFDVMWRANRRNYRLLRDWMARENLA